MKKLLIFKTSYWRSKIKTFLIKIFLLDYKLKSLKKNNNNILIITMDALGDNIVKNKTIEILANEFGKENTYILCKSKWEEIYKLQNYKNIFIDETKWNIFYKIRLYRKLNKIGFSTIAILNHSHLPIEMDYIIHGNKYDMSEDTSYILEKHIIILKKILNKSFSIDDIRPNLGKYFLRKKFHDIISIAVAASNNKRTCTYNNLKNYIENLLNLKTKHRIYLLGTGEKQRKIAEKLIEDIKSERIINVVDIVDLKEVIQIINDSDLFIGGDSGLLNIAFSLGKKSICLHWCKDKYIWEHDDKNIKILKGKGGKEFLDSKYGTDILNSITFEQIKEAIEELENNK